VHGDVRHCGFARPDALNQVGNGLIMIFDILGLNDAVEVKPVMQFFGSFRSLSANEVYD
jgi:hypothetical protein